MDIHIIGPNCIRVTLDNGAVLMIADSTFMPKELCTVTVEGEHAYPNYSISTIASPQRDDPNPITLEFKERVQRRHV